MRTRLMTVALAAFAAASLNAQAPQSQPPAPSPAPSPADRQQATDVQRPNATAPQVITIAGCLKEDKSVPGLKPNVAEKVGVGEDFILTNVKMSGASTVSGIALANRYEVEGIAEAELKKHVNHQVEITGTITQATTTSSDATADFRGTSLKMLSASCAAEQ